MTVYWETEDWEMSVCLFVHTCPCSHMPMFTHAAGKIMKNKYCGCQQTMIETEISRSSNVRLLCRDME